MNVNVLGNRVELRWGRTGLGRTPNPIGGAVIRRNLEARRGDAGKTAATGEVEAETRVMLLPAEAHPGLPAATGGCERPGSILA